MSQFGQCTFPGLCWKSPFIFRSDKTWNLFPKDTFLVVACVCVFRLILWIWQRFRWGTPVLLHSYFTLRVFANRYYFRRKTDYQINLFPLSLNATFEHKEEIGIWKARKQEKKDQMLLGKFTTWIFHVAPISQPSFENMHADLWSCERLKFKRNWML